MPDPQDPVLHLLPLREPTFFILLGLAQGEKHGYAILKDVDVLSGGKVKLSTGTLYEALARLLDQELIRRVDLAGDEDEPPPAASNQRGRPRKAYSLTRRGRQVLKAETARMQALVSTARQRLGEENA